MTIKTKTLQCQCCGKEFFSEYSHGGAIEHENVISNLRVMVSRWKSGWAKDDLFKTAINLHGNHCNIKDHTMKVGVDIFKCVLKWMQSNGHAEIFHYLQSREVEIKDHYNSIVMLNVYNLQKALDTEKARLVI